MKKIILLLTACVLAASADAPWLPNVRVSTPTPWDVLDQGESCFDISGDSIFSVCNTAQRGTDPTSPFAYSFDNGNTFVQIPFVDNKAGSTWETDPVVSVDDSGHLHMIIQFSAEFINHYFSRDGGKTWIDTSRVNSTSGVDKPWGVLNRNEIYVVWQQVSGTTGIWFSRSTDWGKTFIDSRIWTRTGISALCMDDNKNLHLAIVSFGDSIYYRKSTDKGATWSAERALGSTSSYTAGYGDRAPITSITAKGNVVFITWVDNSLNGSWDVNAIRSTDGGVTFGRKFTLNDNTAGGQCKGWAHFDCYGGLHVIYYSTPDWPATTSSKYTIRYRYSRDSGATFGPSTRLTDAEWASHAEFMGEYHVLRSDSQYVYAVWTDGRNADHNDLYFSKAPLQRTVSVLQAAAPWRTKPLTLLSTRVNDAAVRVGRVDGPFEVDAYDASGRMVKRLFAGTAAAPLTLKINRNDMPAGVVFIALHSSSVRETVKMVWVGVGPL